MMHDYRLSWKAEMVYWNAKGPYPDFVCDFFEEMRQAWEEKIKRLPQSEFGWKLAFNMIEEKKEEGVASKEEVREKIDLFELISAYTKLRRTGSGRAMGKCPLHHDKTPSLSVDLAKKVWFCFGEGHGGDCFTWLMKAEGLTFKQALEVLRGYV